MGQSKLKTPYEVLGLHFKASLSEIKKSYRKLSLKYHPDKSKEPDAQKKFLTIKKAYEILEESHKQENNNLDKVESENSGSEPPVEQQPPPNEVKLLLTLEELFTGCAKEVTFTRKVIDQHGNESEEQKTLTLDIKGGTFTGKRIKIDYEGDRHHGKIPANVIFIVTELPHAIFRRVNQVKLEYTAEITLEEAFRANKECFLIDIPTIDGSTVLWRVGKTINENSLECIPEQGFPKPDGNRGELDVRFKINYELKHKEDPIEYDLALTMKEIVIGCKKKLQINRRIVDSNENETFDDKIVRVEIGPLTKIGTKIILSRCGDQSPDKITGDVIFVIDVKSHVRFSRNGADIELKAKWTKEDFPCNSTLVIPTIEGDPFTISLDSVINDAKRFSGYGLPCNDGKRGNLVVRFEMTVDKQIERFLCPTAEELEHGYIKELIVNRTVIDKTEDAKLKVPIPTNIKIESHIETRIIMLREGDQYSENSISNNVVIIMRKDEPIVNDLPLTLEQILKGHLKKFKVTRQIINSDGTEIMEDKVVEIRVKPGTESGTKFAFDEYGNKYPDSYSADWIFVASDKPHKHFKRRNSVNIEYSVPLSQSEVVNGAELTIPTLENDTLKLNVEVDIKDGHLYRFQNRGLPYVNEPEKRGDLIVCFNIN